VGTRARRLGRGAPTAARAPALGSVYAWSEAVLRRAAACSGCGVDLARGQRGYLGLSDAPGPRAWLCPACLERLRAEADVED
jgi:hypothetical protein